MKFNEILKYTRPIGAAAEMINHFDPIAKHKEVLDLNVQQSFKHSPAGTSIFQNPSINRHRTPHNVRNTL